MDTINLISNIYKQQLADANEQKILFQAQCELYKAKIEQLEQQLKLAKDEVEKLRNELACQNEPVEELEAEVVQ